MIKPSEAVYFAAENVGVINMLTYLVIFFTFLNKRQHPQACRDGSHFLQRVPRDVSRVNIWEIVVWAEAASLSAGL